jgi:hypothetical protein
MSTDTKNSRNRIEFDLTEYITKGFDKLEQAIIEESKKRTEEMNSLRDLVTIKLNDQNERMGELDRKIDSKFSATMFVQTVLTTVITVVGGVYLKFFGGNKL